MLVSADSANNTDPLSAARLTLVGRLEVMDDPGPRRDAYLAVHPYAGYYADFTDFAFWRLAIEELRYVGGFGHMSWVTADRYAAATPDPLAETAGDVIAHMNDDHQDANLLYVQRLAGLSDATEATMVGIDRYGVTLQAVTPGGPRQARVPFESPLTGPDDARPAVVALVQRARAST
jgi:putative heme iron utilization protein